MKPSSVANIAIILAVTGWLPAYVAALMQWGDPAPWVPAEIVEAQRLRARSLAFIGLLMFFAGLWCSGYSFGQARWRASIAAALCLIPLAALYVQIFHF